jgi:hypothetical protein
MKTAVKRFMTIALLSAGVALNSCEQHCPTEPLSDDSFREALLVGGNASSNAVNKNTVISQTESPPVLLPDGTYKVCTTKRINALAAAGGDNGFPLFNPNASVIYPGSLIQGASLKNATPDPIAVRRAGGTVSIDIVNGSKGVYVQVEEVRKSTIAQAVNDILSQNTGVLPANFNFSAQIIQSREQLAIALGLDVSGAFASVEANFGFRSDQQYSRMIVKLTQQYYTMSFDIPTSLSQLFAPEVTPRDLAPYVGPGNPATYISDVTFGRVYYMLIESSSSELEVEASVKAAYSGAVTNVKGSVDVSYMQSLSNLNVKVMALGGEAASTIMTIGETNLRALVDLFAQSTDIRSAVPISYVVRNVGDNKIVATQLNTEYDLTECTFFSEYETRPVFKFDPADANVQTDSFTLTSGEPVSYVSRWTEGFSNSPALLEDPAVYLTHIKSCISSVEVSKVKGHYAGRFYTQGVNGQNYVQMHQHRTPPIVSSSDSVIHVYNRHRFNGTALENSDYTIFAVVRCVTDDNLLKSSDGNFFIFSNDPANYDKDYQALLIGFNFDGKIEVWHQSKAFQLVNGPVANRKTWNVYAFRFSQQEGMSIYVNNIQTKYANTNGKTPVKLFRGATVGLLQLRNFYPGSQFGYDPCFNYGFSGANASSVDIALIEAYGAAGSEQKISEKMQQLRTKFGIF